MYISIGILEAPVIEIWCPETHIALQNPQISKP